MGKKNKIKYYSLSKILEYDADYNIIFGERSNGKTYSVLELAIKNYCETGKQLAIIRRFREDFIGKRGNELFTPLEVNDVIAKYSDGEWSHIYYYASRWFLCRYEENEAGNVNRIVDEKPLAYAFALGSWEHDKGTGYPDVNIIMFDEFITRGAYLADEFVLFMNTLSTIIRLRDDVKIFMLANTVNKYCPYFKEMGLKHISQMKQGTIDLYTLQSDKARDGELKIAVEYCDTYNRNAKPSNKYFAFDNAKLKMITRGAWEIDIYPHCPYKYKPKDILFTYFIEFDGSLLQCEIVSVDNVMFTFIHEKTTPLKNEDEDIIYSTRFDARPNWRRKIIKPILDIEKRIARFYAEDKIFYQDNEIGEIVRNYLIWCGKGVK